VPFNKKIDYVSEQIKPFYHIIREEMEEWIEWKLNITLLLRSIDISILFFRKIWPHVATTGSACESRVVRADNGLMDLKRGTKRAPQNP